MRLLIAFGALLVLGALAALVLNFLALGLLPAPFASIGRGFTSYVLGALLGAILAFLLIRLFRK